MFRSESGLPDGVCVFERGWLSSNNILIRGNDAAVLIDSGYHTHAGQTVQLVEAALRGERLSMLLNTHLHSDHCGGNAALQARYPDVHTLIPPAQLDAVRSWDPVALGHGSVGQECESFSASGALVPNSAIGLGGASWEVHSAPGHDPDAVLLFEPRSKTLISADALWENGFGVVFPELDGHKAFEEVGLTLDLIEQLNPLIVIPGHGAVFSDAPRALAVARKRLDGFVTAPEKHARYAAKVLLKFKLLACHQIRPAELLAWASATPALAGLHGRWFDSLDFEAWIAGLTDDLVRASAAVRTPELILNC